MAGDDVVGDRLPRRVYASKTDRVGRALLLGSASDAPYSAASWCVAVSPDLSCPGRTGTSGSCRRRRRGAGSAIGPCSPRPRPAGARGTIAAIAHVHSDAGPARAAPSVRDRNRDAALADAEGLDGFSHDPKPNTNALSQALRTGAGLDGSAAELVAAISSPRARRGTARRFLGGSRWSFLSNRSAADRGHGFSVRHIKLPSCKARSNRPRAAIMPSNTGDASSACCERRSPARADTATS